MGYTAKEVTVTGRVQRMERRAILIRGLLSRCSSISEDKHPHQPLSEHHDGTTWALKEMPDLPRFRMYVQVTVLIMEEWAE